MGTTPENIGTEGLLGLIYRGQFHLKRPCGTTEVLSRKSAEALKNWLDAKLKEMELPHANWSA